MLTRIIPFLFLIMSAVSLWAEETSLQGDADCTGKKVRLLIVTGGHPYDEASFLDTFRSFDDVETSFATLPEDQDMFGPDLCERFDAILFYDQNNAPVSEVQRENFKKMLERGIGLVCLHHHLSSNQEWEEYCDLIGGRDFAFKEGIVIHGKSYPQSTFVDGQTLDIQIANSSHPITQGLTDFTIEDEAYGKCLVLPGAEVLLTTEHPLATREVAWTWRYGNSRIFVNMLGHGVEAWTSPEYREILHRALHWVCL